MNNYQHQMLAEGKWSTMSLAEQLANIGSEVSRGIRWKKKGNTEQMTQAVTRGLELIDLSICCAANQPADEPRKHSILRELTRNREVLCDYFFGDNEYHSDPAHLLKYFDQFAMQVALHK